MRLFAAIVSCLLLAACSSPWPARTSLDPGTATAPLSRSLLADWDDIEASLLTAASQSQCTFASLALVDGGWNGEAISIHDDTATITVLRVASVHGGRVGTASQTEAASITITASPSSTSDPAVFERLLDATTKRLNQLRGVRTAPLDTPVQAPVREKINDR